MIARLMMVWMSLARDDCQIVDGFMVWMSLARDDCQIVDGFEVLSKG